MLSPCRVPLPLKQMQQAKHSPLRVSHWSSRSPRSGTGSHTRSHVSFVAVITMTQWPPIRGSISAAIVRDIKLQLVVSLLVLTYRSHSPVVLNSRETNYLLLIVLWTNMCDMVRFNLISDKCAVCRPNMVIDSKLYTEFK